MTQAGLLEHLKLENVSLSHQLTETQHRSIKEKERIAVQLQGIEADMLDQEAAFVQIQEAKTMVEEDLQRRLEEFEDEKEQLQQMAASATALEQQLEQASPSSGLPGCPQAPCSCPCMAGLSVHIGAGLSITSPDLARGLLLLMFFYTRTYIQPPEFPSKLFKS